MDYNNVFGGTSVPPSEYGFNNISTLTNITAFWPFNYTGSGLVLAKNNDITAIVAGLAVTLPDATQASTGQDFIIKNTGSNTFTVRDSSGSTIATILAGVAKYFVLTTNLTSVGTWDITTFGTGTSAADASILAGAGHKVNGTSIDNIALASTITGTYIISSSDNAKLLTFSGGAATLVLPNPIGLYNGFYFYFNNTIGTGSIIFDPAGSVTIDGSLTKTIQPGESCIIATDGTSYYTIGYGRSSTYTWTQLSVDLTGLSAYTVTSTQAVNKLWSFNGIPTTNITITIPSIASVYFVQVVAVGANTITFSTGSGTTASLVANQYFIISCDGVNVSLAQTVSVASSISLSDGAVGSPALGFALNANTGIYRVGSNDFGIAAGGVKSAEFTTTGMQGAIGATTPSTGSFTTLAANSLGLATPLPVSSGGLSLNTLTLNNVILGNGTSSPQFIAPGTNGNVLKSNGTTWQSLAPTVYAATGTNADITSLAVGTLIGGASGYVIGYRDVPQNIQAAGYTFVLTDAGKHIYASSVGAFTIPANASVAYPIGTVILLINMNSTSCTITITTDTLNWNNNGTLTTGTRTLGAYSLTSILKLTATSWLLSGGSVT